VAKRKNDPLKRKVGGRGYRNACWVSAEGTTERDYLMMDALKGSGMNVRFPEDVHPHRRDPTQVLKRFEKAMRNRTFRKDDEAWILVDVDAWDEKSLCSLLDWASRDSRHHIAISNPKFELFLVMHFERANGCTTPQKVDAALKKHMPRYTKRLSRTEFSREQVETAIGNAKMKRAGCKEDFPAPGMTDAYLLAERLLGE
jgi:hypothetical protein